MFNQDIAFQAILKGDGKDVQEQMVVAVLDSILDNHKIENAFNVLMIGTSSDAVYKNHHGEYSTNTDKDVQALYDSIKELTNVTGSLVSSVPLLSTIQQALIMPNIAGIPISTEHSSVDREIEISESMVIVQDSGTKKYWTDNAVPRLQEWTLDGYLTSSSLIDTGFTLKPSLTWQQEYLDMCARSRRPVVFKTTRGEFVKVQIMNLHFEEDPQYNNAIKISVTLKEYNPYFISDTQGTMIYAQYDRQGGR